MKNGLVRPASNVVLIYPGTKGLLPGNFVAANFDSAGEERCTRSLKFLDLAMKWRTGPLWLFLLLLVVFFSCRKEYSYEGGPVAAGYLLKDANGDCSLITVTGNYKTGIAVTDQQYLQVQVHVGRKGMYTISSDKVNGYSFSATGNFTDTGLVRVKLAGNGKPSLAGTDLFTIRFDSSVCQVKIPVQDTAGVPVVTTNPDHFPLTNNSRWFYDDLTFPGDSVIVSIRADTSILARPYKAMDEYKSFFPATNPRYYTKVGNDYYRYTSVSGFTSALNFSPSIYDHFNFLKEGITTGFSWYSATYTGRTSLGVEVKVLRYQFNCLDADATVVVNGMQFSHVYKIEMIPEVASPGSPLQATGEVHTLYYAKGVGLIYSLFHNAVDTHEVLKIRHWVVN